MAFLHYFSDLHCTLCGHNAKHQLVYCVSQVQKKIMDNKTIEWMSDNTSFSGLFTCSNCNNASMIQFHFDENSKDKLLDWDKDELEYPWLFLNRIYRVETPATSTTPPQHAYFLNTSQWGMDLRKAFIIDRIIPEQSETIPLALPENIQSMYVDDLLQVTGSPRHVLIACRAILEATCKDKLTQPKDTKPKGNLANLIEQLVTEGYLPKAISEWAHTIREFGNSAVHESTAPDRETANEIMMFTKTLLELMYSYPKKIQEIRENHPKNSVAK